jgi:hypothetical protein
VTITCWRTPGARFGLLRTSEISQTRYRLPRSDSYEYFDDSTFGGYLGLGMEFPFGKGGRSLGFTAGARVHFVDFDDPVGLATAGDLGE